MGRSELEFASDVTRLCQLTGVLQSGGERGFTSSAATIVTAKLFLKAGFLACMMAPVLSISLPLRRAD
jgi:hypothetical protein